jgi:hypothetical protein
MAGPAGALGRRIDLHHHYSPAFLEAQRDAAARQQTCRPRRARRLVEGENDRAMDRYGISIDSLI